MALDPTSQEGVHVLLAAGVALAGWLCQGRRKAGFVLPAGSLKGTHTMVLGSPLPFSLPIVTPQAGMRVPCSVDRTKCY